MIKRLFILLICLGGFLNLSAQGQAFRFAQLTDLHISPNNSQPEEDLRRSVQQINTTSGIDFVLITGDITEEGDRISLQRTKSILDQLRMPYYIVPGNHETKWSESGVTDFSQIFGSERFKFEHNGFLFLGFNSGPLMRMAYGHVVPQDISWLKKQMSDAPKSQPIILVSHYPMTEGDVDNWYEVTDAVRPFNIRLFIGGHYHRNRLCSYDGIPGILGRSNLRDKDGIGGYSLFDVTGDSILVHEQRINEPMKRWAGLSLHHRYYEADGKALKYPDFSMNSQYPHVKAQWTIQTGSGIYSSPVVYKGTVFVGDDSGIVSCYNLKNGHKKWSYQTGARIVGTPDVSKDILVFGSADKTIYGLNALNGQLLWKVQADEAVLGAVTIDHGTAYIGASDHCFRAIDIHSGKILWTYNQVKGYIETKPLIAGDKVIFGAWDNTLYALNKINGTEKWRWTGGLTRMHFSPAAVWPAASHHRVFIADPQRAMTAIDLNNGQTIWRTFQSMVRESIGLSEDGSRLYAKTMNDSIVCYRTNTKQPQQIWASSVGFGYEHAPSMLIEKNGIIFGSTKEGVIFALQSKTGDLLWKHKIGNSLINTVLPINKNNLLITSTSGELVLLTYSKTNKKQ